MVLGVTYSTKSALLAGVEDSKLIEMAVYRIDIDAIHEAAEDLASTLDELGLALAQIRPSLIVLLLPESSERQVHPQPAAPLMTLETLIRRRGDR